MILFWLHERYELSWLFNEIFCFSKIVLSSVL